MIEDTSLATDVANPMLIAADDRPLVVIADDNDGMRQAIGDLFESVGIETISFANAGALLEAALPDRPGCFILDVRMPGPSGLDVQARLVENGHHMPIIFLTGHGDVPMSIRAIKAGAFDFKSKPVRDQDLLDAVATAIAADRQRRAALRAQRESLAKFSTLTPRERQVLELIVAGLLNKQIAYELDVTSATVKLHRGNLMRKLEAGSVAELVRIWDQLPTSSGQGDAG